MSKTSSVLQLGLHRPSRSGVIARLALLGLLLAGPAWATVYTYENTTSGTIPELTSNAACNSGSALERTFTVSESFTVSTIALGINLTHADRGQIRAILNAPDGSSTVFLTQTAASGDDPDDNYDILISSNSEGGRDDGDADPTAAPYFQRLVSLGGADFYTGNSVGTWTLRICDRFNAGGLGTFNRARLVLSSTETAPERCTSTVSYDWGANGDFAAFTSTTVGDITITQGTTTDYVGAGTAPLFQTRTSATGAHDGWYGLAMDSAAGVDNETIGLVTNFSFSQPVSQLSFMLMDVDYTAGAWEDQVHVFGYDSNGDRLPYSMSLSVAHQAAGDFVEGDTSVPSSSSDANVTYVFTGAVASLQIEYLQSDDPTTNTSFMFIGMSDFGLCGYDYGDAPASYGTSLSGGARHVLGDLNLYLGTNPPDGEGDGQPGSAATTDDTTQVGGVDDEDGVASFPNYTPGSTTYTVSVVANNRSTTTAATLVGYIDWNRDGDFNDANEVSASVNIPANTVDGAFNVTWSSVPVGAGGTTATYARFRISYTASEVTSPTGLATSGEVEDYEISAGTLPVTLASFHAERSRGRLQVAWTTETETATVGYGVLAATAKGWQRLGKELVPTAGIDRLEPQRYEVTLPDGPWRTLALEDWSTRGERTVHGPFEIGQLYGSEQPPEPIDWRAVAAEQDAWQAAPTFAARRSADGFPVAELGVAETGLARVTYEQLLAAGLDFTGAPVARLALSKARDGKAVPIYVEAGVADPAVFGPGGFVEFRGEAVTDSLYTRTRNYLLAVGAGAGARARQLPAPPAGDLVPSYLEKDKTNRDREYSFAAPNGDPWYEAPVLAQGAPAERSFPLTVDAPASDEGRLRLWLWGVTNWPGDVPDHHLRLLWDGTPLAEDRFDGLVAREYDLALPAGSLTAGEHQLTVQVLGDTGFAFDLVHVDRYTLVYPRRFLARDDRLAFAGAPGQIMVDGLSSKSVVAWAGNGRYRLGSFTVQPTASGFAASFSLPPSASAGAGVEVATTAALVQPTVRPARTVPGDLLRGPARSLIVTHGSFAAGLAPLVAAQQGSGLTVKVVDIEDLYARYSGGEPDPAAIRAYLKQAALRLGVRYVTLVGGDTYDYLDNLGVGSRSFIPTPYAASDELISFTPADALYGDLDGDNVPELAVGRLPARTLAELAGLLAKSDQLAATPGRAVFAADGDERQRFSAISDGLAAFLPPSWPATRAYVDGLGVAGARQQLLSAFDQGAALVSFTGHSGPTVWSFQGLFSSADAASLGNAGMPALVVQWGCWNTYHVSPQYDTLAHRFLLAGDRGAASVVGSSTLSKTSSDELLGPALMSRLLAPGKRLGDALVEAKRAVAQQGGDLRDVLLGWTILGDPTVVLVP